MEAVAEAQPKISSTPHHTATRKQIRGSSLLLAGKLLAVGINFATQVLMVRYLSTTDYGSLAYALAVVAFFHHATTLGLRLGVPRFVPIYHERQEYEKLLGTIVLTLATIAATGAVIIGTVYVAPEQISRLISEGHQSITLLLILIFLIPVEALDAVLIGLFASFAKPRVIFFRKFVLTPSLKFAVILLMILLRNDVVFLAYGYLMASGAGVVIYCVVIVRVLRQRGVLERRHLTGIKVPAKELFAFSIPMLLTDLLVGFTPFAATTLLGYFHSPEAVAFFRVVLPLAHLNRIVKMSFETLYAPTAARLYARNDYAGINDLYWRTSIWLAVLSFPVFVITFSAAQPLVVLLYSARYEQSWLVLTLLSLAYYFNAAFGFNVLTLKVVGKLRYAVTLDVVAAMVHFAAFLILIPRYGAQGAAIGMAGTMILHNVFKQLGLRLISGVDFFNKRYASLYLLIAMSAIGLLALQMLVSISLYVVLPLAALVAFLVVNTAKRTLKVAETFPELLKLPFMKWLLT